MNYESQNTCEKYPKIICKQKQIYCEFSFCIVETEITRKTSSCIGKIEKIRIGCSPREATPDQEKEGLVEVCEELILQIIDPYHEIY